MAATLAATCVFSTLISCGPAPGTASTAPASLAGATSPLDSVELPAAPPSGAAPRLSLAANPEEWTWFPVPESLCANGEPTGIGVNFTDRSRRVLIYAMGGGACWNYINCYVLPTAVHIEDGYDQADFEADMAEVGSSSLFDRTDETNPFKDDSFIWIPYCTGDLHAGLKRANYLGEITYHVGALNMDVFLRSIGAEFPDAERILLAGSSAGGLGATFNWDRAAAAFPGVPVDMLADSGPILPAPYMSENVEQTWRSAWAIDRTLPPACSECLEDLDAIYSYYGETHTADRAGILSYTNDAVMSAFYRITGGEYAQALEALARTRIDVFPQFKHYYAEGSGHVLLADPDSVAQNGVVLTDWIRQMVEDDPTWESVHP